MNKKLVIGIVAGVGVVGGITKLVVDSVKRNQRAQMLYEMAEEISAEAIDLLDEAEDIFDRAQGLVDLYDDDEDFEDFEGGE